MWFSDVLSKGLINGTQIAADRLLFNGKITELFDKYCSGYINFETCLNEFEKTRTFSNKNTDLFESKKQELINKIQN